MPSAEYYKRKIKRIEAEHRADLAQAIDAYHNAPVLRSIMQDGRKLRFTFMRNNELTTIETMGTWNDDIDGWTRKLLDG